MLDNTTNQASSVAGLVPVTVIGGYLGAGKTTLINRMLSQNAGRKLAVLVNDFGAINIDAELIASHDGATISLENGCVCCSIADAMGDALDRVLTMSPDHIVIEASGVADPAKVGVYGQGWPGCRLASIVVLADASSIRTQANDRFVGHLVKAQLQAGDVVLLTKTDLIDDATAAEVRAWIDSDAWVSESKPDDASVLFDAEVIEVPATLTRRELDELLDELPRTVVRAKGVVYVDGRPHIVQLAGSRRTVEATATGTNPTGLIVIRRA